MVSQLYFTIMFIQMILARIGVFSCVSDDDCNEEYSCHKNICVKCLRCDLILRKGSNCVVDFNECGECLAGFEKVLITDSSSAIKPCKPVRLKDKLHLGKCASDSNCPPENYCHKQSCVKCFDCSLVNRLSPVEKCAKELSDCDSCMNGFEEVAVTIDTNIKLCEKQTVTAVPKTASMYEVSSTNIAFAFMFIIVIAIAGVNLFFKRHKVHILAKSQCPKLPSAPPLYIMSPTQQIVKLEERKSEVALTVEQKQQAKVFKHPDAPYYYIDEEARDRGNIHSSEGHSVQNALDEFWSPTNSNEEEEERRSMCSSGIFVHSYVELSPDISTTDSPQQQNEIGPLNGLAADEIDGQGTNISQENNSADSLPETSYSEQENSSK